MGKLVYVKNKKVAAGDGNHWPQKKKVEAIKTWLATGNLTLTAAAINVPLTTVKLWRQQPWWTEMVQDFREQDNIELDSKLTRVLDRTFDAMEDRIQNGDFEYDRKTGQLVRVPVKLRDVHRVTSDLVEKRQVLRKQPTKITEQQITTNDRLEKLASQFAAFVTGKPVEEKLVTEVIDGDFEELPPEYQDALNGESVSEVLTTETTGSIQQENSSGETGVTTSV